MLPWLAQAEAPDANGWNVTTSIATAAALISLATLIVTTVSASKREDRKWARDALSQAFYELIDASYQFSDAIGDAQRGLWDSEYKSRVKDSQISLDGAELAHRQANTKVRLLAPDTTVDRADNLRRTLLTTRQAIDPKMTKEEFDRRAAEISAARMRFIKDAKKAMSLS